ncbi:type VI secretion system tip protein VgrG [uncultured Roseobacter sp.]|uniref:type VI secretion system tip protein VgrG n=1 Tax=uncultured Roseobacter sp. TaxID=114847 RepID=UPI002616ED3E|nr:type VI secretion system tip protein VgrG [uncultured Roseobacter sp.]
MVSPVWSADADLITLDIRMNGKVVPGKYIIEGIETDHLLNRIPKARITIADGSRVEADFPASADSIFAPGAEIEVLAGYHGKNKTLFKGVVVGQALRVHGEDAQHLCLDCQDKAAKLTVTRSTGLFADMADSDAIESLISAAGLSADVTSGGDKLEFQSKLYATDWDFLLARAEANGHVVSVDAGKITIGPPTFETPTFSATYGDTIIDVDLQLSAREQLGSVKATAWDPSTQETTSASASEPSANKQGAQSGKKLSEVLNLTEPTLRSYGTMTDAQLKTLADAHLLKSRLSRFSGTITVPGNAGLKIGDQIQLEGLGKIFSGDAYISAVHHVVRGGDWQTTLGFGLEFRWFTDTTRDVSAAPATGWRPGTTGLEIATVLKTHEDPQNQRRIQVALPLRDGGKEGMWVRLASSYASEGFGIEFLPEVGDEVVLGFLNGDPDAAVMLGALHSSKRTAPVEPDAQNTIKTIVTRAQHKVTFDDDKKIITVETPGGHKLTLSDEDKSITIEDSNKNTTVMNDSGIKTTSPKDITIEATGSVTIKGTGGVDISSPADVSAKGANVSVSAEMALTATGTASAELSATGETTVKGAMVMIN